MKLDEILAKYSNLLSRIDDWYNRCQSAFPDQINCSKGCSECCRSLFDITLLDALYLKSGFNKLPEKVRESVFSKSLKRLNALRKLWPDLVEPYLLNHRPESEWSVLMPEDDETPCVFIGRGGRCLIYEHRPMTCRLHGIPLVDPDGTVLHDEWCTMNFTEIHPLELEAIRAEFSQIFHEEGVLFRELEMSLIDKGILELDTFIPLAVLADYENFDWENLLIRKE